MKPLVEAKEEVSTGFPPIPKAKYIVQIIEGIDRYPVRDDGSYSIGFPMRIVNGEFENRRATFFLNIDPSNEGKLKTAREQAASILVYAGVAQKFEENFPNNDYFDDVVVEAYKVRLPDQKPFLAEIETQVTDGKPKDRVTKLRAYESNSGNTSGSAPKGESAKAPAKSGW